ncbi:hypothetical protein L1887_03796 [Cichorium endivia]|nr:hypothetical protein L1887_03796 [Cichorium endivia]
MIPNRFLTRLYNSYSNVELPPITTNESHLGLIWEQIAILCSSIFVDEWADAAGVAANHPNCLDQFSQNNAYASCSAST